MQGCFIYTPAAYTHGALWTLHGAHCVRIHARMTVTHFTQVTRADARSTAPRASQAHKECIHKVTRNALLLMPHLVVQHYHSQAHNVLMLPHTHVMHIYGGNITRMFTRDRRGRLPSVVYGFEGFTSSQALITRNTLRAPYWTLQPAPRPLGAPQRARNAASDGVR